MKRKTIIAIAVALLCAACANLDAPTLDPGVGFQSSAASDADGPEISLAIWYPTHASSQETAFGPFTLNVAVGGALKGEALPLIVMSHGTGGSAFNSYNLAIGLAKAGFVVAATTHPGDNYQDQTSAFSRRNFVDRPRHVKRTIDFMLTAWPDHDAIDAERIGVFGHSAGGATSLIVLGGVMNWAEVLKFCEGEPDDWGCRRGREHSSGRSADAAAASIRDADARVRAAVVAAPALGHAFKPHGLSRVTAPLQLWVAANDEIVPDADEIEDLLAYPVDAHFVDNAGHFSFLAPCSAALKLQASEICTDPAEFDRAEFQKSFIAEIVKFFESTLAEGHQ